MYSESKTSYITLAALILFGLVGGVMSIYAFIAVFGWLTFTLVFAGSIAVQALNFYNTYRENQRESVRFIRNLEPN